VILLALTAVGIGGCATPQPREASAEPSEPAPAAPARGEPPGAPQPSPAIVALADRADAQARGGEFEAAAANLERALRIEPQSAPLWTRLANVRLEQGSYVLAEDLARRSNSLAPDDAFLQSVNWRLIAEARRRRGDAIGAETAQERARTLEQKTR
jgi:tetratricopeptide (TPR) repeat protein